MTTDPTERCKKRPISLDSNEWYWIRSSGFEYYRAYFIDEDGDVGKDEPDYEYTFASVCLKI